MQSSRLRQALGYLGAGMLLGVGTTLGGMRFFASAPPPSVRSTPSPAVAAAPTPAFSPSGDADTLKNDKEANPRSATDWERVAARLAEPGKDPSIARSLLLRLNAQALGKLAASVAAWPPSRRNFRILGDIYERWGQLDLPAVFAQAQTLPPNLAEQATRRALGGYVDVDPAAACALLAAPPAAGATGVLGSNWSRRVLLNLAMENWAERDAVAAANFASRLPNNACGVLTFKYIAQDWMSQDPNAALQWAQNLGAPDQRGSALVGIVNAWAQTEPTAAANYVLGLPGGSNRQELIETFAATWTDQDPNAAARWALQQNGKVQGQVVSAIAKSWGSFDPQAAVAWSNQLPADGARTNARAAIAEQWYDNDPVAAQNWLGTLPAGDERDAAISGTSQYWNSFDRPLDTLALAQKISDPGRRNTYLADVLNNWLKHDRPAARQWINQADLPEKVTDELVGN